MVECSITKFVLVCSSSDTVTYGKLFLRSLVTLEEIVFILMFIINRCHSATSDEYYKKPF